jgi:hypothetical protein
LSATSSGTLSWFAAASGGTSLGTGTTFTTPSISANTTYYVQATSNGCSSSRSAVLATVNPAPTMTTPTNQSICTGQASTAINFSGSTGNTYAWTNNNTSIGLAASGSGNIQSFTTSGTGTATISVSPTLNSCVGTPISFTLSVSAAPAITGTAPGSRCGTGTVSLSATSSGTLSWYAAASGGTSLGTGTTFTTPSISANTTYYVQATSNGCSSSRSAVLATINPAPTMTSPGNKSFCLGQASTTINFSGSTGSTYTWSNNNSSIGLTSTGSGNIASFTPSAVGTATISVTPTLNSCTGAPVSFVITVTNCTANLEDETNDLFLIYPNPTSGLLTLKGDALNRFKTIELFDESGRMVGNWTINSNLLNIDLTNYAVGNYNLNISGANENILKKIQINR